MTEDYKPESAQFFGWNILNSRALHDALRGAGGKEASREAVIQAVAAWWDAPEQADARDEEQWSSSVFEDAAKATEFAASFGGEHLEHVIERAATSPTAREGLRRWAQGQLAAGGDVPRAAQARLFESQLKKKRGRQPGSRAPIFNRDMQLFVLVWALCELTAFSSLSTTDRSGNGAFEVAGDATRETFDVVRDAWREGSK